MARKISELYDALNSVKANMPELGVYVNNDSESLDTAKKLVNDVRTGSKVAIWRLWLWIMAVASWVVENMQELHEAKINAILAAKTPHTLRWYAEQSKLFQYGHELEWLGDHWGYPVIVEEDRLIKYAVAVETEGGIKLKIANADKAAPEELVQTAFMSYWAKWKDAGVVIDLVTGDPNVVTFTANIHRNRNIINANNTLIADTGMNVVQDPANAYLESVDFGGVIYMQEIAEAIKAMPGVLQVTISVVAVDQGTLGTGWTIIPENGFAEINWSGCTLTYTDSYE